SQLRFIELARAQATVPLSDKGLRIRPTMRLAPRTLDLEPRTVAAPSRLGTRATSALTTSKVPTTDKQSDG
ncbi:MAG TPA: hypothetical protein PLA87_21040, partial [Pseudomonadota bacterium]|nr:hypothetical protein [Pseudomonadota bacterium]